MDKDTTLDDAIRVDCFPQGGANTYFVTAQVGTDNLEHFQAAADQEMRARGASIAFQYLFGGRQFYPQAASMVGNPAWPIMLLHGDSCSGTTISGTQFFAVSGAKLHAIRDDGRTVGTWYETENARYCLLGDIRADDLSLSRMDQAYAVFEKMESLLRQAGMDFTDTARTWIYLKDLLEWYDDFNVVRTRFFQERGVFGKMVPASTGIGAGSAAGEHMVSALLAVKPINEGVSVKPVPSPMQCPALDYKSSFARAVEIRQPEARLLTISGTASIAMNGKTLHVGDTRGQIELTMEVVHEILRSRGMDWRHTVRAIAYFKDIREAHLLTEYMALNDIPELPVVLSHADVCRDDLLFELELDAVREA